MIYKKLIKNIEHKGVVNGGGEPSDYQQVKQQVETNKQDITNLKAKDTQLENAIALNQQKIEAIKSLDNLVNGDNIILSPQGDKEVFINTTKNLNINALRSDSGVITIQNESHFNDIAHLKHGAIFENDNNQAAEIDLLDNDLKIINNNGDILLVDKVGAFKPRETKTLLNQVVDRLKTFKPFSYKGNYVSGNTYNLNDIVSDKNKEYLSLKDNNTDDLTIKESWVEFGADIDLNNYYDKAQVDSKFQDTNNNVIANTSSINDLKLKHQLVNERLDKIAVNHKFTIDPLQSANWELNMLYSELDPTDPSKSTIKLVPSTLKEYQLKHSLDTFAKDIELVKGELKDILTSTNKDTIKQLFYGQEDKDQDPRTYGYITSYGTIPLQKQVGVRTFGNIFNVDYNEWNGVFYNGVKIPFGTKNDNLGIDLTSNSFQATSNIQNITLYKEVVNDGITETEVNEKLKSYATNDSVDSKDSLILQQAKDYGDSLKPQIMDLNGGDFTWSDSYALYYKEVKPSQIPFNKVISYSIWSTNNIGKNDFNGLALTAFVRQISSGGFNVYIMNNSNKISAINEFKVRISYFK